MNDDAQKPDLATRLFENFYFVIGWIAFLLSVLKFVGWPLAHMALVCWVYGSDAYFLQGIRVLKGKPTRFSNGELAPDWPNAITGFAAFFLTVGGLSLLLVMALRLYERHFKNRRRSSV